MRWPRYCVNKAIEGLLLGIIFYMPFSTEPSLSGVTWSVVCSVITGLGVDFLWEKA